MRNKGIHIKFRKERNTWEVVEYVSGSLKRYATGFSSRKEAEEKLAEIIIERNTPKRLEDDITLGEILAYYTEHHLRTLNNPRSSLLCVERLAPFWGNLRLKDISKAQSNAYHKYRSDEFRKWQEQSDWKTRKPLSSATIRRELEILQATINFAHQENIITINPFVWKPEKSQPRDKWFTRKEAARLLNEARNYDRVRDYLPMFILIGLYTGARASAITKLRWTDINFETNRINTTRLYNTKNKKGSHIPIPRKLRGHLLRHRKRGVPMGYVVHKDQNPIERVNKSFSTVVKRANLTGTPHVLRHTFASWKVQEGHSYEKIGQFAGMSAQMVERVYGHLSPDHLEDIANG